MIDSARHADGASWADRFPALYRPEFVAYANASTTYTTEAAPVSPARRSQRWPSVN